MPGLSLKSEEYKSFLIDAAVPSSPLCCFIIFIVLFSYRSITGYYSTIFCAVSLLVFILSLFLTAHNYRHCFRNHVQACAAVSAVFIILAGSALYLNDRISRIIDDTGLPARIENISVVIETATPKRYSTELAFHTAVNGTEAKGIIYYHGENSFNKGDEIFLHSAVRRIEVSKGTWFNRAMVLRGIHYTAAMTDSDITVIKDNGNSAGISLRKYLLKKTDTLFDPRTAGVVKALFTGNQGYIEKNIILKFRDSGVLHCLSASGLHVAIFAAIPAFLLVPFFRKNIAAAGSLVSVLLYLYITDMPVSLLRAVIMFAFFYLQLILYRKKNVFNYLMLTCSLILFASPWELFSPGFQLSFSATAGILLFYKPYRNSVSSLPPVIADTAAVTLAAQVTSLPIILFHMNQLNTAGLFSNIIIIPLITLIMGVSLFAVLVSFISAAAASFAGLSTGWLLKLTLMITDFFFNLKLNFYVQRVTPVLLLFILLGVIPLINRKSVKRLKFYPVIISLVLCTAYLKSRYNFNGINSSIYAGNSSAEIIDENSRRVLKLNISGSDEADEIISEIKKRNTDIKVIELANSSRTNLLASKILMNDFIIDEYRFSQIPEMSNIFKKIIFQLEKDDIRVKFAESKLP